MAGRAQNAPAAEGIYPGRWGKKMLLFAKVVREEARKEGFRLFGQGQLVG
jgi:hypothetical protein